MTRDHEQDSGAEDRKPEPPREPESGECCQSGCDPCVFDRYWDALDRYEQALALWESRRARRRPEL